MIKPGDLDLYCVRRPVINAKSLAVAAIAAMLLVVFALPVIAAGAEEGSELDWFSLGMGLFGGLAMFLFGMEQMSGGLQAAAGDTLKDLLAKLTRNRVMGAITGAIVTAVLNSSSVTTVLVVGFMSAGFMSLAQSVGVIMGANIGSRVIVRQSQRIAGREGAQIDLVRLEMELLDNMRRIYTLAKRVAKEFVPHEVGAESA